MIKKSRNKNNNKQDNLLPFPQTSPKTDGAKLRDEYEKEKAEEYDIEEVSDEIANYVLEQVFNREDKESSYMEVLFGLNKAYVQTLLQLVEDSGYNAEEYLENFSREAEALANNYIDLNNGEIDPVQAAGSLALSSAYLLGALDEEEE